MLDHEETLRLISLSQDGDQDAKTKLVEHNMPLIKSIVKRFKNKYIEYDDLIQLGSLGLVKAINNFKSEYGVRFSTYAVPMITGEIKRFIRDDGSIKVSRAIKLLASKITAFVEQYSLEYAKEPTIDEIAEHFGIDAQEAVYIMDSSRMPVSLYDKFDDDGKNLLEKIPAKDSQEDMVNKMVLKEYIAKLPDREKLIITLRYYKDKTQSEIAGILGVSQVQVSRLESKIIDKLKKALIG